MQTEIADRLPVEAEEIAGRSSHVTFYQTATWIDSLRASFPGVKFRCVLVKASGKTVGYLPFFAMQHGMVRMHWSLPFGTYGGPVTAGEASVRQLLVEKFFAARRDDRVHEVGLIDYYNNLSISGFSREVAVTHMLELDRGFEYIWENRFDKSKRRQTRRAGREGIEISEASTLDEVKEYHSIYKKQSEKWQQRLKYPESLFAGLVMNGRGHVKLFLARAEGRLLGGHLNFYFGDTVIAWNGVTTPDSLGRHASTLLYSSCIRHACDNGYKRYNLGGSLGKKTLVLYKESLGGVPYEYRVHRWRSLRGKVAVAVKKRLPRR